MNTEEIKGEQDSANQEPPTATPAASATGNEPPFSFKPAGPPELEKDYTQATLRAKPDTIEFFLLAQQRHKEMLQENADANKSDAFNFIIKELMNDSMEGLITIEQAEALEQQATSLQEQVASLQAQLASQPANDLVLALSPQEAHLLKAICDFRFKNKAVREKYKLTEPETPAQMLIHMIRNADNLYNANGNFYTGFTSPDSVAAL